MTFETATLERFQRMKQCPICSLTSGRTASSRKTTPRGDWGRAAMRRRHGLDPVELEPAPIALAQRVYSLLKQPFQIAPRNDLSPSAIRVTLSLRTS